MNIVNTIARSGYEFLVINIVAVPFIATSPWVIVWYSLCVLLAFVLRIGMMHKDKTLNSGTLLWQSIATIGWSFIMILVWEYVTPGKSKGFEIYLFVNSFFASFAVSQFEQIGKTTIKKWLRAKLSTFLAVEKEEDKS